MTSIPNNNNTTAPPQFAHALIVQHQAVCPSVAVSGRWQSARCGRPRCRRPRRRAGRLRIAAGAGAVGGTSDCDAQVPAAGVQRLHGAAEGGNRECLVDVANAELSESLMSVRTLIPHSITSTFSSSWAANHRIQIPCLR